MTQRGWQFQILLPKSVGIQSMCEVELRLALEDSLLQTSLKKRGNVAYREKDGEQVMPSSSRLQDLIVFGFF